MIPISKRSHGFVIQLAGRIQLDEVKNLSLQLQDEWAGLTDPFVLVLDAREFRNFSADAQAHFETLLEDALNAGLVRITTLAISTGLANLFCNIMVRTELMPIYQYLDLAYEVDYKTEMNTWLNEPFLTPRPVEGHPS